MADADVTVNYPRELLKMIVGRDDWSGVTDPAERRKRQNRLRQRLAREKKRAAAYAERTSRVDSSWNGFGILIAKATPEPVARGEDFTTLNCFGCDSFDLTIYESFEPATGTWKLETHTVIPPLMLYTTAATFGQPTPPLIFPLSPDHCLLTMVQYNVQRASLFNLSLLSLLGHLPLECGSTLNLPSLAIDPPNCVPPELLPTTLQKSTPHEYWIDIFPCPVMRDNLIRFYREYDAHDLQHDLAKSLYQGFADGEQRGCMVWGQPWTANGWEVSEGFVRKWGFLLKDCSDLLASTNRWRENQEFEAGQSEDGGPVNAVLFIKAFSKSLYNMQDGQIANSALNLSEKKNTHHVIPRRTHPSSFNMPRLAGIANFNPEKDIPSLSGKVVLVTGGTGGLGKQSIQALAKHGPQHIYFSGRNQKAADAIINDIKAETPGVGLTFLEMDFSSLESVRVGITQFAHDRLDVLMCNAGVMAVPPAVSKDGFEIHFAINHLAHAMIIRQLLPVLIRTAEIPHSDVRVVCLTSEGWKGHPSGGILYDKVRTEKGGMPLWLSRYGQSKFANLVFAAELGRRFPKLMVVSVHPGVVKTDLVNTLSLADSAFLHLANLIQGVSILSPEEGVLNQLWTAVGANRNDLVNGAYYKPVGVLSNIDVDKDKAAKNPEVANKLWTWTNEVLDSILN